MMAKPTYQDWADRVVRLCGLVRLVLDDAAKMGVPAPRGGWVDALFQKLEPQLTRPPFLVVAVTGGTNSGKSTVFNQLAGDRVSRVVPTAMGSKHPVCLYPNGFGEAGALGRVFPGFRVKPWTSENDPLTAEDEHLLFAREDTSGRLPQRLVLLDTPDIDGALSGHWERARLVSGAADVLIAVLTFQKYNDEKVRTFFREAAEAKKVVIVVWNMVDWDAERGDCETLHDEFIRATDVDPIHVYVCPRDREAAEENRLPFHDLATGEDRSARGDLADLRFDRIKIRTFLGALGQVLDPGDGLPALLHAVDDRAREYADALAALAEVARVKVEPPALPGRVVTDVIWNWFEPKRTWLDRRVHGAYSGLGRLITAPFRAESVSLAHDFKEKERAALTTALDTVLNRLKERHPVANPLLKQELDRILSGEAREQLFKTLEERHARTAVVSDDYRAYVWKTLDEFEATNPRWVRAARWGLVATAVARPVLTIALIGGPTVAVELAHHTAVHTVTQVAGEVAVGAAVSVGAEGAAVGLKKPIVELLTRLFARYYEGRAQLLSEIIHDCVLGQTLDRMASCASAPRADHYRDACRLVDSLSAELDGAAAVEP